MSTEHAGIWTRTRRPITLADVEASGLLDEYAPGPPPGMKTDCIEIDRDCAAQNVCGHCGATGGRLVQFHSRSPRLFSYLAYSVCRCGAATEF